MMLAAPVARRHAVGVNVAMACGESSDQGDVLSRSPFMLRTVTETKPRPTAGS
jgi:hypothetical protein